MSEGQVRRHVTVEGVRLRFAAAHMATIGAELEPLHGHNYQVRCRVGGALADDRWVIDFGVLKRLVREACEQLDHKFLLQRDSTLIEVFEEAGSWRITFEGREYRFPRGDVAVLPIENTTAELIAEWICDEIAGALSSGGHQNIETIGVDVEEMPGQSGGYSRSLR